MAWGLEARVPFLDKAFLEVALNVDAKHKMFSKTTVQELDEDGRPRIEKVCPTKAGKVIRLTGCPQYIIRKAFDCAPDGKPYLPKSILWRQKEQFSDGVGYSWIDGCAGYRTGFRVTAYLNAA